MNRPIAGWPGYSITTSGDVYSTRSNSGDAQGKPPKKLKPYIGRDGYARVTLCAGGGVTKRFFVHRLVMETFLPYEPDKSLQGMHLDGDRTNNDVSNLAWGTAKENNAHKAIHGTWQGGERNGEAKLTEAQVRQIIVLGKSRATHKGIAAAFGISKTQVGRIIRGASWKHITAK